MPEETSHCSQQSLFDTSSHECSCGRTSQEHSRPTTTPSAVSSESLWGLVKLSPRQGEGGRTQVLCLDPSDVRLGGFVMPNGGEWPNDAAVSSLSRVLMTGPIPRRYFLSPKATAGILRRAEGREKGLPIALALALLWKCLQGVNCRTLPCVAMYRSPSAIRGGATCDASPCLDASYRKAPQNQTHTLVLAQSGANAEITECDLSTTLTCIHDGPPIVLPLHDMVTRHAGTDGAERGKPGREGVGKGHGLGVGEVDDPMFTLTGGDRHAVLEAPIVMAPAFSKRPGQQIATREDDMRFAVTTGEPPRVLVSPFGELAVGVCNDPTPKFNDDLWHTLRARDKGGGECDFVMTPFGEVRRLTPTECSRLQGLPDDWAKLSGGSADGSEYAAYGNSMAEPVVRWLGARIQSVMCDEPYTYGIPEAARDEIEGRNANTTEAVSFAENQRGELRMMGCSPQLVTGGGKPGQGYPAVLVRSDECASARDSEPT